MQPKRHKCPKCGKKFGSHAEIGTGADDPLRPGDLAVCFGCATPLIITATPYEARVMTAQELAMLDPGKIEDIVRLRQAVLSQIRAH